MSYVVLVLALIVSAGCATIQDSSPAKVYEETQDVPFVEANLTLPEGYTPPLATQLTFLGDSGEGYFNSDGTKIIYQSRNRSAHAQTRIYTMDLKTKKETLVATQPAEYTCAYFDPRNPNQVIYASTQDEVLEHPEPEQDRGDFTIKYQSKKRKYEWKFHPYEIYKHNLKTRQVTRLTHSVGYDAEATFNNIGSKIIFTSLRDGDLELYMMDRDGMNQHRLTHMEGYDGGAFISPDNTQVLWRGFHHPDGTCHLYTSDLKGEHVTPLTVDKGIHWCPSWHPSGQWIVYSSNRAGIGNFELYLTDKQGKCHKRLTYSPKNDILPVFSPDGRKILFTSDRAGETQYMDAKGKPLEKQKDKKGRYVYYSPDIQKEITKLKGEGEKDKTADGDSEDTQDTTQDTKRKPVKQSKVTLKLDDKAILFISSTQKGEEEFFTLKDQKILVTSDRTGTRQFVSPNGKKLLATSTTTGRSQLFIMDFVNPDTPCL